MMMFTPFLNLDTHYHDISLVQNNGFSTHWTNDLRTLNLLLSFTLGAADFSSTGNDRKQSLEKVT